MRSPHPAGERFRRAITGRPSSRAPSPPRVASPSPLAILAAVVASALFVLAAWIAGMATR